MEEDEVVTATTFRDFILVITKKGYVYRIWWDSQSESLNVAEYAKIQLKQWLT